MFRPAALCLLALATAVQAESPLTPSPPAPGAACAQADYHQFDFWLGEWNVTEHGQPAGHSRIEAILKHCAIAEHWSGAQGGDGKSYNAFDPSTGQWQQFWVSERGTTLLLRGGLRGKAMVLEGEHVVGGAARRERITWTPNDDGSVRQRWDQSGDDGKTWSTVFDGLYRRSTGK